MNTHASPSAQPPSSSPSSSSGRPSSSRVFGLPLWLLAGVLLVLLLAVFASVLRSSERERLHVLRNYFGRAEALIWALESGARANMSLQREQRRLQPLIEETARQPGIVYMALVGADGRIFAHSDRTMVGGYLAANLIPRVLPERVTPIALSLGDGQAVFEVYRRFSPTQPPYMMGPAGGRAHGHMQHPDGQAGRDQGGQPGQGPSRPAGREPDREPGREPNGPPFGPWPGARGEMPPPVLGNGAWGGAQPGLDNAAEEAAFAVIGFDKQPFEQAMAADDWYNAAAALGIAGIGLACVVSLFWAYNYRISRRKLKDSQALSAEVVGSLPLGLLVTEPSGKISLINDIALDMLRIRREDAQGRSLFDMPGAGLSGIDWRELLAALRRNGRIFDRELELKPGAEGAESVMVSLGASRIRDEDGRFLGHLFILRDISEVRRLQQEVQRNERLRALGTLAAGVAHEIRNPLSSIKGLATYLARKAPSGGPEEEAAKTLAQEVDRLNRVVSELLEFARPSEPVRTPGDLNEVIARALRLAGADIEAGKIRVEFTPSADFPLLPINAERITQALLNLFLNAVQAMQPGGRLSVRLERRGGTAAVIVSDTGHGIAPERLAAVFTPYFTDKAAGTGLGLAIVQQIAEEHGGKVSVESEPGRGSVFTLALPV